HRAHGARGSARVRACPRPRPRPAQPRFGGARHGRAPRLRTDVQPLSHGLLVHSLLPPASRARFGWVQWLLAGLWLHVVIFAITWLAIVVWLRPEHAA